jgi:putative ABC transport system ATP-binding protein
MTVLELDGVTHAYRRTPALRGVSAAVAPGEVLAVTGPSGSGKSTLLLAAAGVLRVASGSVRLLGRDLAALDEAERCRLRRRELGLVLQFGQLVPDLAVRDNVALPLLLDGERPAAARAAADALLERVGLADAAGAVPAELSGGQAQRAAVARALVARPPLVLADEPTGSTDTATGRCLLDLLLDAVRDRGAALVLVTHDNTVAARADRELRLRDGVVEHDVELA